VLQLDQLDAAAGLLAEEVNKVNQQVGHSGVLDGQFVEAWRNAMSEMIYLPAQKRYGRIASATNSDKVDSLQVLSCDQYPAPMTSKIICYEMTQHAVSCG
jgi:hypothetical protein